MRVRRTLFLGAIAATVACARPAEPVRDARTGSPFASAPTEKRTVRELPLRVRRHEGRPIRLFVDVVRDGRAAVFLVDTGAAVTHLTHGLEGPQIVHAAGRVTIGGDPYLLDSWRRRSVSGIDGLDAIGTLGADAFIGRPTELDLRTGRLAWLDAVPDEAQRWTTVPLVVSHGVMLTDATVDGRLVRLLLDTGTAHLLLLVSSPGEGKTASTTDALGNRITLVWGSSKLEWGRLDEPRVPTWRTSSHPAFEKHARQFGGADGLLGLSALGARRLVFDAANGRVFVEP